MVVGRTIWRKSKRVVLTVRLPWLALLFAAILLLWLGLASSGGNQAGFTVVSPAGPLLSRSFSPAGSFHAQASGARSARVFYPYSVIPGGARSVAELKEAIASDPVVAVHYAAFDLQRARLIRLDRARAAYVSYRIGNRIYWTKRMVRLARGENVITDGDHMARTRCGNLVSATPAKPVSSKEPTVATLDTPEGPHAGIALLPDPSWLPLPDLTQPVSEPLAPNPPLITNLHSSSGGGGGVFLPLFFFPGGGFTTENPQPPVVPVPEPGTLAMLLTGLPAILLLYNRRRN
jgi:hypothetical protein